MGNIQPITNETEVLVNGSISYVSQTPWIQNDTVRNNVLFYKPMTESKYNEVISLCELTDDLKALINGDATQIGEKGVTLSGGQKMRIALARGLYANSNIYLLDDPFAALDANVGKSVMSKCIKERLHGKTRILITHSLQYLNYAEQIVLINKGKIVSCFNIFAISTIGLVFGILTDIVLSLIYVFNWNNDSIFKSIKIVAIFFIN